MKVKVMGGFLAWFLVSFLLSIAALSVMMLYASAYVEAASYIDASHLITMSSS
ncbi:MULTISPECIES: hypothetical protein [Paenibacillus]|uniref:hypothetical protein n=1 Tax=Paenibacillus TaxID=44249 RepID=UPI00164394A3|nr:hypothetical protein [Paenibacillus xylanexedens]